jgi:choline dehydrogenase-like flavoprotein
MKTAPEGSIVVIGGGTMGLYLAHELSAKGKKVVLIEAGDEQSRSFGEDEYKNLGLPHTGIAIGRAKGVGGTTNLWGGQLTEFLRVDIESKANYGQPDWVVGYAELEKYYAKTYKKLGFEGEMKDYAEALKVLPDKSLEFFYTHWLRQPNFKNHFYKALQDSPLVTVYESTTVTKLTFSGNRCTEIDLLSDGQKEKLSGFDQIVLANGTFEICRLLLDAVKEEHCPFSNNQLIGKYYQDHIVLRVGSIRNASKIFFGKFSNVVRDGNKLQPKLRINSTERNKEYLGVCAFFSFSSDVTQHLDNFKQFAKAVLGRSQEKTSIGDKVSLFFKVVKALPQIMPLIFRYIKDNQIYVPFNSKIVFCIQAQQISIKDSAISISKTETDGNGRPKVELNWKIDGRELKAIREFSTTFKDYLEANKLGTLVFEDWFNSDDTNTTNWLNYVGDIYHQAGGVVMGATQREGVVDKDLRVHETANLFACGPWVFAN